MSQVRRGVPDDHPEFGVAVLVEPVEVPADRPDSEQRYRIGPTSQGLAEPFQYGQQSGRDVGVRDLLRVKRHGVVLQE